MAHYNTEFTKKLDIEHPIICGPMYPCSNPELVAAASESGGIGIVQPLTLVFVFKYDFREGLKYIKSKTDKPIGMNLIVEKSSKKYEARMKKWLDIALEEGIRFFITSLGNPKWVVEQVAPYGGIVYHDVVDKKWAKKAVESGVHGLIGVNNQAGGHAGGITPEKLFNDLSIFGLPVICAGSVSDKTTYDHAMKIGYAGVQMGTKFIATKESLAHQDYKDAIVKAEKEDIVLTEKISGVPVAVIKTKYIEKIGTKANAFVKYLLKHPKAKHWMRMFYTIKALWSLKRANLEGGSYKDYWQAGKSVENIHEVKTVQEVFDELTQEPTQIKKAA